MNLKDITNWISDHLIRVQRTLNTGACFVHRDGWRVVKHNTPGLISIQVGGKYYHASIEGGQVELGWI